jgi:hypothetical protein
MVMFTSLNLFSVKFHSTLKRRDNTSSFSLFLPHLLFCIQQTKTNNAEYNLTGCERTGCPPSERWKYTKNDW